MRSLAALVALACVLSTCSLAAQRVPQTAAKNSLQATAQTGTQTTSDTASQNSGQTLDPNVANLGFGLGLGSQPNPTINPLTQPTLTPGMIHLMELETQFASAVAAGGGKAFASWFADEGVTLANGRPPVIGREAIAAEAQWDPKNYQLTWTAEGAQMGPSNDMGFTWGHYEGTGKDAHGQPVTHSGRYMTVWKRMSDGSWKVMLDASADEPPDPGSCCALPKP
jgi:ketosteroid isomerase-like protein